jgi:hypothetical protein
MAGNSCVRTTLVHTEGDRSHSSNMILLLSFLMGERVRFVFRARPEHTCANMSMHLIKSADATRNMSLPTFGLQIALQQHPHITPQLVTRTR